eukprot:scaffold43076_cov136-Cyclotella_meneghiniana.AAC.1
MSQACLWTRSATFESASSSYCHIRSTSIRIDSSIVTASSVVHGHVKYITSVRDDPPGTRNKSNKGTFSLLTTTFGCRTQMLCCVDSVRGQSGLSSARLSAYQQSAADRWQNLKKDLIFWKGTQPCVAESGATGN